MERKIVFSNESGKCKLVVRGRRSKWFDSVSSLLDYCSKKNICVTINDCVAE